MDNLGNIPTKHVRNKNYENPGNAVPPVNFCPTMAMKEAPPTIWAEESPQCQQLQEEAWEGDSK